MANAVLVEIRQGIAIDKRHDSCRVDWGKRSANLMISYTDRPGSRTTSTIDHAEGSGDVLDVYTQNSRYRFRVADAHKLADRLNQLRAEWSVMHALSGFMSAFA